jgi:hypothetical protein
MGLNRTNYVQYETYETWLLYEEFCSIPGNIMDIDTRPGTILTTEMMHNVLNTAYKLAGYEGMDTLH